LRDYIETIKRRVPRDAHHYVYEYLSLAEYHASCGDMREMSRYLDLMRNRQVQELRWAAENCETAHRYRDAYYTRRQADRMEGKP
jgi:hypothetical protein